MESGGASSFLSHGCQAGLRIGRGGCHKTKTNVLHSPVLLYNALFPEHVVAERAPFDLYSPAPPFPHLHLSLPQVPLSLLQQPAALLQLCPV